MQTDLKQQISDDPFFLGGEGGQTEWVNFIYPEIIKILLQNIVMLGYALLMSEISLISYIMIKVVIPKHSLIVNSDDL